MADEELKELLGVDEGDPTPSEESKAPEKEPEKPQEDPELKAKAEQKANLDKAILEAQNKLRELRKQGKEKRVESDEEELPHINEEDPGVKAWTKRFQGIVAPSEDLLERARAERRTFALREFLKDKPTLAADPEKVKRMMGTYDRLKEATELTSEGIMVDLERAYAAENYEELRNAQLRERAEQAEQDAAFAAPAVSRGSTTYGSPQPKKARLSEEERDILKAWERAGAPKID